MDTVGRLESEARRQGLALETNIDLTSLTRPGTRLRDHVIALTSPLCERVGLAEVPFFGNVIGGHALQLGLRDGFLQYRLLVFRKVARQSAG